LPLMEMARVTCSL